MPQAIREGVFTILFISGPLVILAAALGLAVGIIQAATQVQEQTLGSAVKVIGLLIVLVVFGFYMFQYMRKYTAENIERAFKIVPTLTPKVLPRRNFLEIPKEDVEDASTLPALNPVNPSIKKAGSGPLAESQRIPDEESINENLPAERIPPAGSQNRKDPNAANLKTQTLPKATTVPAKPATQTAPKAAAPKTTTPQTTTRPTTNPAQTKPAAVTPKPIQQTPAKPATVTPKPAPVVSPEPTAPAKRLPRSSSSSRLDRLKEEVGAGI